MQEILDALVEILGGDKPLLIIPAILGNNNHGGITSVAQMALSELGEQLLEKASLGARVFWGVLRSADRDERLSQSSVRHGIGTS